MLLYFQNEVSHFVDTRYAVFPVFSPEKTTYLRISTLFTQCWIYRIRFGFYLQSEYKSEKLRFWTCFIKYEKSIHKLNNKYPACNYPLKVNNRNTRTRCEICSKLTIKIPERRQWPYFTLCSSVSIVNFEQVNAGCVASIAQKEIKFLTNDF